MFNPSDLDIITTEPSKSNLNNCIKINNSVNDLIVDIEKRYGMNSLRIVLIKTLKNSWEKIGKIL
jgi:hypothetical protein